MAMVTPDDSSYGSVETPSGAEIVAPTSIPKDSKFSNRTLMLAIATGAAVVGTLGYANMSSSSTGTELKADYDDDHVHSELGKGHPSWIGTVDAKATDETLGLAEALGAIQDKSSFLFGHQNTNYKGQYFKDKVGTMGYSDVYNGTGSYPAVFGFDWLDVIENGQDFTEHVQFAYSIGAVIAFDWKPYNPEYWWSTSANDLSGTPCSKILELSGSTYDRWTGWLDTIADNIKGYKYNGVKIPIIFRLLHENTGGWYWWGTASKSSKELCSDSDYKGLFNFTQYYLNEYHSVHQILWLYAPAKPSIYTDSAFSTRYPGHDRVDLIGFDRYSTSDEYKDDVLDDCRVVGAFCKVHGKIACVGETGITDGLQDTTISDWYYDDFAKNMMTDKDDMCTKISYAMAWENVHPDLYWVPLPQDATWNGMQKMYESDYAFFADDKSWQKELEKYGYFSR